MRKLDVVRGAALAAILLVAGPVQAAVQRINQPVPATQPVITFTGDYLKPNPSYSFQDVEFVGDVTVSFGSLFVGQALDLSGSPKFAANVLSDSSPSSPLTLDPNGPAVGVLFETWASDKFVVGGMDLANNKFFHTPLAVHFSTPVNWLGFDAGVFGGIGALFEVYDADGNSLGVWENTQLGVESVYLKESTGQNVISGLSVYILSGDIDCAGFGLDNLRFGGDPNVVPEPATWMIWLLLGTAFAGYQVWWRRSPRRRG